MPKHWWQDVYDRREHWQGLMLNIQQGQDNTGLQMITGANGRMKLVRHGETLFWASMAQDHSGVWLISNIHSIICHEFLSPIRSTDIEKCRLATHQEKNAYWCRYFARQLAVLFPRGQWLLRPLEYIVPPVPKSLKGKTYPATWQFATPSMEANYCPDWHLSAESMGSFSEPATVTWNDWWWSEHLLLSSHPVQLGTSRGKWWHKKCREGSLPPILLWFVAGLGAYLILDGHYRLQAALEEQIPPSFIVVSEVLKQHYRKNEEQQQRLVSALSLQQKRNPGVSIDGVNQTLINAFDDRGWLFSVTRSRAILGDGKAWEHEVTEYLERNQLMEYIEPVLSRESW